jgi:CHAT domain-containing protein
MSRKPIAEVYEFICNWKAINFDITRTLNRNENSQLDEKRNELRLLTQSLATAYYDSSFAATSYATKKIEAISLQRDNVERELGQFERSAVSQMVANRHLAEIQSSLPSRSVLLDFWSVRPNILNYRIPEEDRQFRHLYCFAVTRDRVGVFDLGSELAIKHAIEEWRDAIYGLDAVREREEAHRVNSLVFLPISEKMADLEAVFICPEGPINGLPWSALPGRRESKFLIEELEVCIVPALSDLKDLAVAKPSQDWKAGNVLLVGDVAYDSGVTGNPVQSLFRRKPKQFYDQPFSALPGTRVEVDAIADVFARKGSGVKIQTLSGTLATESVFRRMCPRFDLIHLATHGFFASEDTLSELASYDAEKSAVSGKSTRFSHPGLLSGLAMANANLGGTFEQDDGLITALEAQDLSLRNARLVVLSGCQTSVGLSINGEGITGLQRSFHIAGAKNVLASLWAIDDESTALFFSKFYENLSVEGRNPRSALRATQIWAIRSQDRIVPARPRVPDFSKSEKVKAIDRNRSMGASAFANPRNWAAFVVSGTF